MNDHNTSNRDAAAIPRPDSPVISIPLLKAEPHQARSLDMFLEDAYSYNSERRQPNDDGYAEDRLRSSSFFSPCYQWKYWAIMLSLGVANSSEATEIFCISFILPNDDFKRDMFHDSMSWKAGLLSSAVFAGMLTGGLVMGSLGDYVGRRPIMLVGSTTNAVAGVLSTMVVGVYSFSILRFVAGLGFGATMAALFTLVAELAPPSRRGFFIALCASFWMVGAIYVTGAAWILFENLHTSWRLLVFACALPSALAALLMLTVVPESPRFLALMGRQEESVKVANMLAEYMAFQNGPSLAADEVLEYYPAHSVNSIRSWGCLATWHAATTSFYRSARKLYSKKLFQTSFILQVVWFSLHFGSYGILTWINSSFVQVHLENIYFNAFLIAISSLPGNIYSTLLIDRVGRSAMLVSNIAAAAASLLSVAYFSWNGETQSLNTVGVVASACAFQCFSVAAWNAIIALASESFPTTVRSSGVGVCTASGRLGTLVAQAYNGYLIRRPLVLLLVAGITLFIAAVAPCFLPDDSTGRPVKDELEPDHAEEEEANALNPTERSSEDSSVDVAKTPYLAFV